MNTSAMNYQRVLAIAPCATGFGFVVLEGPERLIDYGIKGVQGNKNSFCLEKVTDLIEHYQPEAVALENPKDKACRRCLRIQELLQGIIKLASGKKIRTQSLLRPQIRDAFLPLGASTKYQIAFILAERFPELMARLPPLRKPWMSEDKRLSVFDALALGITHFVRKPN